MVNEVLKNGIRKQPYLRRFIEPLRRKSPKPKDLDQTIWLNIFYPFI